MLRCRGESLYTGMSGNLVERIAKHKSGRGSKYVRSRLPAVLCYVERAASKEAALAREREIKKLRRSKKLELIDGNIESE